jgi:hypothetical protein
VTSRRTETALWFLLLILGASAFARNITSLPSDEVQDRTTDPGVLSGIPRDRAALTRRSDSAVARAPFRLGTGRSLLRFGETPPEPRPVDGVALYPDVRVSAIVGGPPWQAVLQGVPGVTGDVVVRRGDRVGELSIGAITVTSVRLVSPDTSWLAMLPLRVAP